MGHPTAPRQHHQVVGKYNDSLVRPSEVFFDMEREGGGIEQSWHYLIEWGTTLVCPIDFSHRRQPADMRFLPDMASCHLLSMGTLTLGPGYAFTLQWLFGPGFVRT